MKNNKKTHDWFLEVPWGRLAMVSWGDSSKPPALLVHGFMDSAATFIPLVNLLPDDYYFISYDQPGHARSDPLPTPTITHMHLVEAMRQVVEQLQLDSFICFAHSAGYLISNYYNVAYPGRMSRMVALDPPSAIGMHYMALHPETWFRYYIANYYEKYISRRPRICTYDEAVTLMMRARWMTKQQGELILSRVMEPAEEGKYRLLWDSRVRKLTPQLFSPEMLSTILVTDIPTLTIETTQAVMRGALAEYATKIYKNLQSAMKDLIIVKVQGEHNIHFTHPELLLDYIVDFLNKDTNVESKL